MSSDWNFDIAVIGSGPGGYPAAIKAAQLGKKVAIIEAREIGGTCLNRGCIPSKALIYNASIWNKIQHASDYGIHIEKATFDFSKMKERKDQVVGKVRKNLESLLLSNNITIIRGYGKIISQNEIAVNGLENGIVNTQKIIIATGSEPKNISAFPFDYQKIHDSTSILELTQLPQSIAIIGGGVIGCEFASLYNAFGVEVTILEMMPSILPQEDPNLSKALSKIYTQKGIKILTEVKVLGIKNLDNHVQITLDGKDSIESDIALVCVGRSLNTEKIGLDKVGIIVEPNGILRVNDKMETNVPNIYAIGDIASKWWLAHVATHQGIIAASNACGEEAHINYDAIPNVIFSDPEIASVGMTLSEALSRGYEATQGNFPFQALGKSQATMETEGFGQIVFDKKSRAILGAQVIGSDASTLIAEMALAIANELTLDCLIETIHAHPTVSEIWLETGLFGNETPLHLPLKKRRKE